MLREQRQYMLESVKTNFVFTNRETKIEIKDNCLDEHQNAKKIINKNWKIIKEKAMEKIESLIDSWYKEEKNGKVSYRYGINKASKAIKYAVLDYVRISMIGSDIRCTIFYNSNHKGKDYTKFFDGHSFIISFDVDLKKEKIKNIECGL